MDFYFNLFCNWIDSYFTSSAKLKNLLSVCSNIFMSMNVPSMFATGGSYSFILQNMLLRLLFRHTNCEKLLTAVRPVTQISQTEILHVCALKSMKPVRYSILCLGSGYRKLPAMITTVPLLPLYIFGSNMLDISS